MNNLTIGSDVEIFFADPTGKNITAEGKIKGSKDVPFVIDGFKSTSLDCVSAEYCINPVTTKEGWMEEHRFMINYVREIANSHGLELDHFPGRVFEEDQVSSELAKLAGCQPDFNMRLKEMNEKPRLSSGLRSIG